MSRISLSPHSASSGDGGVRSRSRDDDDDDDDKRKKSHADDDDDDDLLRAIRQARAAYPLGKQLSDARRIYSCAPPNRDGEAAPAVGREMSDGSFDGSAFGGGMSRSIGGGAAYSSSSGQRKERPPISNSPALKHNRRALRAVERMHKLLNTRTFERLLADRNEEAADFFDESSSSDSGGDDGNNNNSGAPPTAIDTSRAIGLGMEMETDPESTFSSERLCKEFSAAARIAYRLVNVGDDTLEVVLEERSLHWGNADVAALCREGGALAQELQQQVHALHECAASFCGAAERVLRGARDEVRHGGGELVELLGEADALHAALEEKKSRLAKERKAADDLRASNRARSICLRKGLIVSQPGRDSADDDELTTLRARLRMLLSAASMQIRGQKSVEEQQQQQQSSPTQHKYANEANALASATTTRVMQAIDVILNSL